MTLVFTRAELQFVYLHLGFIHLVWYFTPANVYLVSMSHFYCKLTCRHSCVCFCFLFYRLSGIAEKLTLYFLNSQLLPPFFQMGLSHNIYQAKFDNFFSFYLLINCTNSIQGLNQFVFFNF